jgi:hypothetical protein
LLSSQFALEFIKAFILKDEDLPEVNYKLAKDEIKKLWQTARNTQYGDLFKKELFAHARMYASVGEHDRAKILMKIFQSSYVMQLPEKFSEMHLVAIIDSVKDSEDRSTTFNLTENSNIDVFSIGEGQGKKMWDYGWIENVTDKKIIWQMNATKTAYAGGAEIKRLIDTTFVLPAGTYLLRYKSDNSHSYDLWNDLPPAYDFYGIMVYK